jgi:hypothetical protein
MPPMLTKRNQVIAIGAVTMQKHDKLFCRAS